MTGEYEAAILDLDGTVYRGEALIPGADGSVGLLRERGLEVLFVTNKAIERRDDYAEKLSDLGVPATRDDVMNSGWVTAEYVAERHPDRRAYVVGEEPLIEEFQRANVPITRDEAGELLVVSMDRGFDYEKLDLAMRTLEGDAPFVATNADRTCPTADGAIPDAAGMIGAVEGVTGRTVDAVLGKPSSTMVETALGRLSVDPERCLMVGDRLETDVRMGNEAGMTTVLVLSGVTDRATLEKRDIAPDHVVESIAEIESVLR
ncbi:MAG: HAD-IIA family hydrolase [Haloferacaceae archaeon]